MYSLCDIKPERIDFAIKKANGKRTGMYEIIPISMISAFFRRKKIIKKGPIGMSAPGSDGLSGNVGGTRGGSPPLPGSAALACPPQDRC